MPRYYFDFNEGGDRSRDDEGLSFDSKNEAHREAATTLAEMARERLRHFEQPFEMGVVVRDDKGHSSLEANLVLRVNLEPTKETRPQMVERHVLRAEELVLRQRAVVHRLAPTDPHSQLAIDLLREFEGALATYRRHKERASVR
jgi:hypothetical protein